MKKFLSIIIALVMMLALAVNAFAYEVGEIIPEDDYFYLESIGDEATFKLAYRQGSVQYKIDNGEWNMYTSGMDIVLNKGDRIIFKGSNVCTDAAHHFTVSNGRLQAGGTLKSLALDDRGEFQGLRDGQFDSFFRNVTSVLGTDKLFAEINGNDALNVGNKASSNSLTPFSGEESFNTGNINGGQNTEKEEKANTEKKDSKEKDGKESKSNSKEKDEKGKTASMTTNAGATVTVAGVIAVAGIAAGVYCVKVDKKEG